METTKKIDELILETLDVDGLSESEITETLGHVKNLIIENTLLRLVADSSEEKGSELENFLDNEPSSEEILNYLGKVYQLQFHP